MTVEKKVGARNIGAKNIGARLFGDLKKFFQLGGLKIQIIKYCEVVELYTLIAQRSRLSTLQVLVESKFRRGGYHFRSS